MSEGEISQDSCGISCRSTSGGGRGEVEGEMTRTGKKLKSTRPREMESGETVTPCPRALLGDLADFARVALEFSCPFLSVGKRLL